MLIGDLTLRKPKTPSKKHSIKIWRLISSYPNKQRAFSTALTKPAIIGFKLRVEEEEEDIHGLVIDFEEMA
jgi:hypothetical protein